MSSLAITPLQKPVTAEVTVPGSKSYTIRALLMAAMTPGSVTILHPLFSDDTAAMVACLKKLGINLEVQSDKILVKGDYRDIKDTTYTLNVDLSGTTMRFLLAFLCAVPGVKVLQGKEGLNKRPVRDLVDGLRQLGASIEYMGEEGFPPVRIAASSLRPGTTRLSGAVSSQYFSAILMTAPLVGEITVEVEGEQISRPYINMTIDSMRQFGVVVHNDNYHRYRIAAGQVYAQQNYLVEGDFSSASYFFAIAALTGSTLTLHNLNPNSVQGDRQFMQILEDMGNVITVKSHSITMEGKAVSKVDVDMQGCPDQAQTLAVLMAFAKGTSKLRGIQSLRVKETERVKAVEQELAKMGIATSSTHDTLTIRGGNPQGAAIDTYGDHRMAMSFAVAGTKLEGMRINDPEVVSKTFPSFWETLQSIGVALS